MKPFRNVLLFHHYMPSDSGDASETRFRNTQMLLLWTRAVISVLIDISAHLARGLNFAC